MKYIIVLVLLALGCSKLQKDSAQIVDKGFTDTLELKFRNLPLPNEKSTVGTLNNQFYYTYNIGDSLGLYVFNIKGQNWNTIFFQFEGENGLVKNGEFVLLNDSLAIHPLKGMSSFQLINYKNGEVDFFKFNDSRFGVGEISDKSIYYDGKIIGFPLSYYKSNLDKDYTSSAPIYGLFDLDLNKFVSFLNFPEEFLGSVYSLNFLSRTFLVSEDFIYLNMMKSHSIYKYDLDLSLVERIDLSSENVNVEKIGVSSDQMENMMKSMLAGEYSSIFEKNGNIYRTVSYFPNSKSLSISNLNDFIISLEDLRFEIIKYNIESKIIKRFDFSGTPKSKGIGDNIVVNSDKLYFWLLDKTNEDIERFVSID